jgi:hypothetical protein
VNRDFFVGACALVLALAVGAALCGAILVIAIDDKADDMQLGTVITTLAGAAVGAIAAYVGGAGRRAPSEPAPLGDGDQGEAGQPKSGPRRLDGP